MWDISQFGADYRSTIYRIAGNFGEVLIWRFRGKSPLQKPVNNIFDVYNVMTSSAVAKFKICQYVLGSNSPNLMLTKVFRYTVCIMYEKENSQGGGLPFGLVVERAEEHEREAYFCGACCWLPLKTL